MVCEGFKRKWSLPGGLPLLLELLPTVFLHIYRILCVHKLKPSLSKTVIGHGYAFRPASATLLAPSSLEKAMLEKQIPLTRRCLQVHAEPACQWSALVPAILVDCMSLLQVQCFNFVSFVSRLLSYSRPDPLQVLLQMGGECACILFSILEATFVLVPEASSSGMHQRNNAHGICTIRFDWLQKPRNMVFSSQSSQSNLLLSSFRPIDCLFHYIFSLPTKADVCEKMRSKNHVFESSVLIFNNRSTLKLWTCSCCDTAALLNRVCMCCALS
jgi:hypothetical protein